VIFRDGCFLLDICVLSFPDVRALMLFREAVDPLFVQIWTRNLVWAHVHLNFASVSSAPPFSSVMVGLVEVVWFTEERNMERSK